MWSMGRDANNPLSRAVRTVEPTLFRGEDPQWDRQVSANVRCQICGRRHEFQTLCIPGVVHVLHHMCI